MSSASSGLRDQLKANSLHSMLQRSICKAHGLGSSVSSINIDPLGLLGVWILGNKRISELTRARAQGSREIKFSFENSFEYSLESSLDIHLNVHLFQS